MALLLDGTYSHIQDSMMAPSPAGRLREPANQPICPPPLMIGPTCCATYAAWSSGRRKQ